MSRLIKSLYQFNFFLLFDNAFYQKKKKNNTCIQLKHKYGELHILECTLLKIVLVN